MRIRVHAAARAEVREAASWYEQKRQGFSREFLREYFVTFERARLLPQSGALVADLGTAYEVRHFLFPSLPYMLIIATRGETGLLVAVMHQRREPGYWVKRLAKTRG